jgi:hypothetical protein
MWMRNHEVNADQVNMNAALPGRVLVRNMYLVAWESVCSCMRRRSA